MKFLIVSSIEEDQNRVVQILKKAGISKYSTIPSLEFEGDQPSNPLDEWFAMGKEHVSSMTYVCFTSKGKAESAFESINAHNAMLKNEDCYPIKAHIIAIEKSTIESSI